jgi:hypothetical protein
MGPFIKQQRRTCGSAKQLTERQVFGFTVKGLALMRATLGFRGRRLLFRTVGTPVDEDEVGVVGPATAQQFRGLCESEDVFASQIEEARSDPPKHPEGKRH